MLMLRSVFCFLESPPPPVSYWIKVCLRVLQLFNRPWLLFINVFTVTFKLLKTSNRWIHVFYSPIWPLTFTNLQLHFCLHVRLQRFLIMFSFWWAVSNRKRKDWDRKGKAPAVFLSNQQLQILTVTACYWWSTESMLRLQVYDRCCYLIAQRCQIGGRFLPHSSDLSGRHQGKHILYAGRSVRPELIPERVICGLHGLEGGRRGP